jgi:hypothetical protein
MVRSLLIVKINGRRFINAGRKNDDSNIYQNSFSKPPGRNTLNPRGYRCSLQSCQIEEIFLKIYEGCSMENVQEKKTWMRSHKPKGLSIYFEQLINRESDDYGEQVANMGNIKCLINEILIT